MMRVPNARGTNDKVPVREEQHFEGKGHEIPPTRRTASNKGHGLRMNVLCFERQSNDLESPSFDRMK